MNIEKLEQNHSLQFILLLSSISIGIKLILTFLSIYIWSAFTGLTPILNGFTYFFLGTGLGYLILKEKSKILKTIYFIIFSIILLLNYFSSDILSYNTWGLKHSNQNNIELSVANRDINNFLNEKTGNSGVKGYIKYDIIEGKKTDVSEIDDLSFSNIVKLVTRSIQELANYLGFGKAGLIANIIWLIVAVYFVKWGFASSKNELIKSNRKVINVQTENKAKSDKSFVEDIRTKINELLNQNKKDDAYKLSYNAFSKYRERNTVTRMELLSVLSNVLCKGWNNETAIATLQKMKEHKLSNDYINDLDKAYIDEEIGKILMKKLAKY